MATRIVEPASSNPQTTDWQNLLNKLTKTTGAHYIVGFTNMDNIDEPEVVKGSRFEINGSFFEVTANEAITGWDDIVNERIAYVYAIPNSPNPEEMSSCVFAYSITKPTLDVALGGLFDGTNRCIGWVFKRSATSWEQKAVWYPQFMIDVRTSSLLTYRGGTIVARVPTLSSLPSDYVVGDIVILG